MAKLKKWNTEKIQNIVKTAVEQMPEEATNIRLIEGFRHSIGAFGTHHNWTEVEAVYENDDNREVGRVRTIDKVGGWQYSEPANYVLYHMGLYKPQNIDKLKTIKARYEEKLNYGLMYPINEIYSTKYLMDLQVKEVIFTTDEVDLIFKLDYNSDMWGTKYTKPCDYRVILNGFETEPLSEYNAYFLFVNALDMLIENGVKVHTVFDMKDKHKDRLRESGWVWREEVSF